MSRKRRLQKDRFYIAYGSNLNLEQMTKRCPTAEVVQAAYLKDWRLMFRGGGAAVATVERHEGGRVPILIWTLQPDDEDALDFYEGYPHLYRKEILQVTVNGRPEYAMIYIMNEALHPYGTPSCHYLDVIRHGYETFGFNADVLRSAIHDSVREAHRSKKDEEGEIHDGND